jgi:uncharacterized damage-inducible protein DinB
MGEVGSDDDAGGRYRTDAPRESADTEPQQPIRSFGWSNMFVSRDDDPRSDGGFDNDERAVLAGSLADQRLTLELKCAGLDTAAMARRSVAPSNLSLLGLVRHLADVERYWFREVMAGQLASAHYRNADGVNVDFDATAPDPTMVAQAWATWREEVTFAERCVADTADLGALGRGEPVPLREVLVHMIEEYARHIGHADLLRERIDGRIGQ